MLKTLILYPIATLPGTTLNESEENVEDISNIETDKIPMKTNY